ncbi:MAG: hypothetical protein RR846_01100 [Oscillospiraceae bacterium]
MENLIKAFSLPPIKDKQELVGYIKENYKVFGRKKVTIKIYKEKRKEQNPYYSFSGYLNDCTAAAKEIIDINLPLQNTATEQRVIGLTEDEEIKFFMKNNLFFIDRIVGGHRSKCENDTEVYLSVYTKPLWDMEAFLQNVKAICTKNTAKVTIEVEG